MGLRAVQSLVLSGPFNLNTLQTPETFFSRTTHVAVPRSNHFGHWNKKQLPTDM